MISKIAQRKEAFVWIWLPGETEPVVAGRIAQSEDSYIFNYGTSYLERENAIPIYEPELPLRRGLIEPTAGLSMMARYASYEELAEIIRHRFTEPKETLRELYARICCSILCGNTDDHARNHAAFWDGKMLTLTPAYDICPQGRTDNEATQAMLIKGNARSSTIAICLAAAPDYHLKEAEAAALIEAQIATISERWQSVCDEAELSPVDRKLFAGRQFLNPFCLEGLNGYKGLQDSFVSARDTLIAGSVA